MRRLTQAKFLNFDVIYLVYQTLKLIKENHNTSLGQYQKKIISFHNIRKITEESVKHRLGNMCS